MKIAAFCALTGTHSITSDHSARSVMLKLLLVFSQIKQRVFQQKAPTAPGSSTEALFVCVLIVTQTHACDCTRCGAAEMGACWLMTGLISLQQG